MDFTSKLNYRKHNSQNDSCVEIDFNKTATETANKIEVATSSHHYHCHEINNGNSSSSPTLLTSNKRKRSVVEEKDNEYEKPAKRFYYINNNELSSQSNLFTSSCSSPNNDILEFDEVTIKTSETQGSSDRSSAVTGYDLDTPSSDDNVEFDGDISTTPSSGTYCSSNSYSSNIWSQQERGDQTPYDNKIKYRDNHDECNDNYTSSSSSACVTPVSEMPMCPLPALSWANASDVWNLMCKNDEIAAYDRNPSMLENHPGLQPRMRAILLDWLIEVSEVYKLHRETYYLAVDYIDRYLSITKNVQKTHLQLIGITCLFIAAKVEEIYPPKLSEFAYVTDGACQEEEILQHELLILKALDWDVNPLTVMAWLGVYMQLNVTNRTADCFSQINSSVMKKTNIVNSLDKLNGKENLNTNNQKNRQQKINSSEADDGCLKNNLNCNISSNREVSCDVSGTKKNVNDSGVPMLIPNLSNEKNDAFIYPQFSGMQFVQTCQLLDLCSLDVGIANYRYSVLAAAAMSLTFNREIALRVSGIDWNLISPCVKWMEPFFSIICEESHSLFLLEQNEQINTKFGLGHICPNIVTDDSHIIQTHTTSVEMFDKLVLRLEQKNNNPLKQEASPAIGFICPEGLLTPPASNRKPLNENEGNNVNSVGLQKNKN